MAPWLAFVEAYLVKRLLQSPSFHRAVHRVHKGVHRLRHGTPPEEMGGTNIDNPGPGFMNHFFDEIREQTGRPRKSQLPSKPSSSHPQPQQRTQDSKPRDSVHEPQQPNGSFASHFMDELRQQFRGGDKNR